MYPNIRLEINNAGFKKLLLSLKKEQIKAIIENRVIIYIQSHFLNQTKSQGCVLLYHLSIPCIIHLLGENVTHSHLSSNVHNLNFTFM